MRESFRIIAIRTPKLPDSLTKEEKDIALRMMKKVGENSDWLYFHNDVFIDIDDDFAEKCIKLEHRFVYQSRIYDLDNIHIDVCAIVGSNGTGKSSIVDLLIRTINNVAAALVGELYVHDAAEHLHYIENVYSDLCFELDDKFYIIEMRGRKVIMHIYSNQYNGNEYIKEDNDIYILDNKTDALSYIEEYDGLKNYVFEHFFYTLICNYSMYGFNYRDYLYEQTPVERLKKIYGKLSKDERETRKVNEPPYPEDTVWLKGLFYKNDGYQTPLVIHPMRLEGVINVNRENRLAKERLLKTFFYKNSKGEYPLRTINRNLHAKSIKLSLSDIDYGDKIYVAHKLSVKETQNIIVNYDVVGQYILNFWKERYKMKRKFDALPDDIRKAIGDYIVYKTVKIARTYAQYKKLYSYLRASNPIEADIHDALWKVYEDGTHRTRKLMRAIHFVTEGIYIGKKREYSIKTLSGRIEKAIEKRKANDEGSDFANLPYVGQVDTFLPPAIFDCDFIMSKGECDTIEFAHLSSGEKQIAYTISSFLYHVSNIDSEWYTKDSSIKYKYINAVFDEVEQYYHPELQRRFLSYLLNGLSCMDFRGLKGVNFIIVTHSPFVLSDIPRDSILVQMNDEDKQISQTETFCGNINEMLAMPFFLPYAVGEVAREKMSGLISMHRDVVEQNKMPSDIEEQIKKYEYLVNMVGDTFIKMALNDMLDKIKDKVKQTVHV